MLWSASQKTVHLIELTVPREDSVEEAYKRKKAETRIGPAGVGCRGRSAVSLLGELGVRAQSP